MAFRGREEVSVGRKRELYEQHKFFLKGFGRGTAGPEKN